MLDLMTDRERFEQGLLDAQALEQESMEPKRERLALIEKLIADCERDAQRLVSSLAELPSSGLIADTLNQMTLSHAGWADDDRVVVLADEVTRGQVEDLFTFDRSVELPVEILQ